MALMGCKSRQSVKGISETYAMLRSSVISQVHYDLSFHLDSDRTKYDGRSVISFKLKNTKKELTVDFNSGHIHSLEINGKQIAKPNYNKLFIVLPKKDLKSGQNKVVVEFTHDYSTTGSGLYRFKDPEDGRVYTYSDFEPYDANEMFPCFDQPDLKATYSLTAEVPKDWKVISATQEVTVKETTKGRRLWVFPKSAKFSTYIFSMHAGPYKVWKSKAGKVPLRIYARQAFAKYVKVDEWFKITQQGLKFFNAYFNYPYPFKKYDQLLVPDFNSGAMENVAAVTFNEAYLPRGKATRGQRENLAEVILHEMAHMWFGNLVTMKWWDDLWLNESFASYMAYLANANATEFKEAWHSFYAEMKQWAYWEDQLVTTHPIVGTVKDTESAFVNFDGITYGKGASVLKQLSYFLGEKNFQKGVQNYFKKYEYKNTKMVDFIGALANASKKDLGPWTKAWLKTASVNTIEAKYGCKNGNISNFKLIQTADSKYNHLRAHRTKIGFYEIKGGKAVLKKTTPVAYRGKTTSVGVLNGTVCPELIYPNEGDYDYVKVTLDAATLSSLKENLSNIQDNFARLMFWQSLWDMVRDAKLPVWDFNELVFRHLKYEKEVKVAKIVVGRLMEAKSYLPKTKPKHVRRKDVFIRRSQDFFWAQLAKAKPGSDLQKLWFDSYVQVADRPSVQEILVKILSKKIKFKGLEIDQDRRWNIIVQLSRYEWKDAKKLSMAELKKDTSEKGKKSALATEVIWPSRHVKKKWFKKVSSLKSDLSLARTRTAAKFLFPGEQEELQKEFTQDFFKNLVALSGKKPNEFLSFYTMYLAPAYCTDDSVKELSSFIKRNKKLPPVVIKRLRVTHQEDERCLKIRNLASQ